MQAKNFIFRFALVFLTAATACAQGIFIYDQQSSDESGLFLGSVNINNASNPGQSFTPSLSVVGFIRLYLEDGTPQDLLGATFQINLRSNSVSGPIISSTAPVTLLNGISGAVNFFFNNPVSVTPGTTYYFDLTKQSGSDPWTANIYSYNYTGGTFFVFGAPDPFNRDLWFREGIYVVPEPSSVALVLVGCGLITWHRRKSSLNLSQRSN